MERYEPRPIRFHGIRDVDGWRLKVYSIAHGPDPVDWSDFDAALAMVDRELPLPAQAAMRTGVGFVIAHRGRTALYCVLGWWDNENELPLRVFVRGVRSGSEWRRARGAESICVWDLQVIGFERDAYVTTVLDAGAEADAVDQYLARVLHREPEQHAAAVRPAAAL